MHAKIRNPTTLKVKGAAPSTASSTLLAKHKTVEQQMGLGRRCHHIIETMKGPHLNLQNRPRSARSTHMEQSTILRHVEPKCMSLPAKCAAPRRRVRTGPSAASLLGALDALWLQQCTTTLLPAAVRCSRTHQAEPRLVVADLVHG